MNSRWQFFFSLILLVLPIVLAAQQKVIFKDVAQESGVDFRYTFGDYNYENILESSGSGITVFDYNNDGFMDLLMMNGTYLEGISDEGGKGFKDSRDKLFKNNGDGTFTETGKEAGIHDLQWSMAAGAIDLDNDGFEDFFLLNYGSNVFYHNNGDGTFEDITPKIGLAGPETLNGFTKWSIGVSFWDYNLDGRLDAMVGNFLAFDPDYISTQTPGMMPHPTEYKGQASILYEQQDDATFKDVTEKNALYFPDSKCMGLTVADYDNDGDLDIYIVNLNNQGKFLRNNKGNQANWILLDLIGTSSNRDGIGCRIKIVAGNQIQTAQKKSTTGYLSQNDTRVHFGMATATVIDEIEIKWPSGKHQVLENVKVNQILKVKEPL